MVEEELGIKSSGGNFVGRENRRNLRLISVGPLFGILAT